MTVIAPVELSGINAPLGTKATPWMASALAALASKARDHNERRPLILAGAQMPHQVWRDQRHRYADWLDARCPQPGRNSAWAPRMCTTHVPAWGDDLAHGGWAAVIDFAAMRPQSSNGELWVELLEGWVESVWRQLCGEVGLHLVSSVPHTTGFGCVVPQHLADADRPTVRALNGVTGAFGSGQHGARALALSWLALDGLEVVDPREAAPRAREQAAERGVDLDAPPSVLLSSRGVLAAISRHHDRLTGNRDSYGGDV